MVSVDTGSEQTSVRPEFSLSDVQGNILRGYRKAHVRHLCMRVVDVPGARRWSASIADQSDQTTPTLTDASDWETPPDVCFNIGVTHLGLTAVGVPDAALAQFSEAFREGMPARADKLGDWGSSAPINWQPWFQPDAPLHAIVTLHADSTEALDSFEGSLFVAGQAPPLEAIGRNEGSRFDGDIVHFGYRDNISQPRFEGVTSPSKFDDQPLAPLGTVLLGHPTAFQELEWTPDLNDIRNNATFNAFRVLQQDVGAFEDYLTAVADELSAAGVADHFCPPQMKAAFGSSVSEHDMLREVIAAKLCGRWRTGTPLELSPHDPSPDPPVSDTDFDYVSDHLGIRCPYGAHTRRTNPRGSRIVQQVASHTRRLVRRGIPYGPSIEDSSWQGDRGLLGSFLCADLAAQFEGVQQDWLQLGMQDPRLTGSNDALIGSNSSEFAWFDLPHSGGVHRLRGIPQFVTVRGGAYTMLPSLNALRSFAED